MGKHNGEKAGHVMYHFFAQHENIHDTYIEITGDDVRHLKNVLRMKPGDELLISSGSNTDYRCHISEISDLSVRAEIDGVDEQGRELESKVYLFQGLPKGDKMELIIQKMVELGAFCIVPVAMKRSVVKLDGKKCEAKVKRWNMIAESAAKQSKRSIIPEVADVCSFKEALAMAEKLDVKLLPYECADGMEKTRNIIRDIQPGQSIGIFIGPEGGYELEELSLAKSMGWEEITLGKRILRTETAGMMLMSVLMYKLES